MFHQIICLIVLRSQDHEWKLFQISIGIQHVFSNYRKRLGDFCVVAVLLQYKANLKFFFPIQPGKVPSLNSNVSLSFVVWKKSYCAVLSNRRTPARPSACRKQQSLAERSKCAGCQDFTRVAPIRKPSPLLSWVFEAGELPCPAWAVISNLSYFIPLKRCSLNFRMIFFFNF